MTPEFVQLLRDWGSSIGVSAFFLWLLILSISIWLLGHAVPKG